ncbi:MAG TPA: hypothetical protein DDY71_15095 [Spirochaetia bacterium]|nr:MAG: hypothetical protein A2Y30_05960 [Spirochaetes bacterium GWE1_32_154]OHD49530.1 MAG: hypothetical protein A2Y29_02020 [Spirochaetes bacterium GWE2_31_10]HBD95679.1 hypothetical protein [Spirochaetia bacterium]HBI38965.1 hypothetical protein [Spirochaetia bacterium]
MKKMFAFFLIFLNISLFADDVSDFTGFSLNTDLKTFHALQPQYKKSLMAKFGTQWIYSGEITGNSDIEYILIKGTQHKVLPENNYIYSSTCSIKCDTSNIDTQFQFYKNYFLDRNYTILIEYPNEITMKNNPFYNTILTKRTIGESEYVLITFYFTNKKYSIDLLVNNLKLLPSKNALEVSFGVSFDNNLGVYSINSNKNSVYLGFAAAFPISIDYFINKKISFGAGVTAKIGSNIYIPNQNLNFNSNGKFTSVFFLKNKFANNFYSFIGLEYGVAIQYNFLSPFFEYDTHYISPHWSYGPYLNVNFRNNKYKYFKGTTGIYFQALLGQAFYFVRGKKFSIFENTILTNLNITIGGNLGFDITILAGLNTRKKK